MLEVSLPANEYQRLQALRRYRAVNSNPDPVLDRLIRLAANLCGVPIAFIGFLDEDQQVIKAALGWPYPNHPRSWALCNQAILQADVFTIANFAEHPSLAGHPWLKLDPLLRFYAGVPLLTPDRLSLGTLALMDHHPHDLTPDQRDGLLTLAQLVMTHLHEQESREQLRLIQRQQEKSDVESRRHALIFAHIYDGLIVLDLGGQIIDVNPGATMIFGWERLEFLGKTTHLLHGEALPSLKIVKAVLSTGRWQGQQTFIRKDKSTGTVEIIAVPLQNRNKQIIAILVIYHDISDRCLAEIAWEQQKVILEVAQQNAQAANQAKSDFLAMMSHEIRTPMSAVISMTDILAETPLSSEQQDFVNTIKVAGESLLTIVNEVLDLSKLESGTFELDSYPFNLRDCIENTLDLFAVRAAEKGLGLFYLIEPDLPLNLEGDGTRLGQILMNLVGNALKFTEVGEITVTVARLRTEELTVAAAEKSLKIKLQFAVKDTGIGISPERQMAIFQPYVQAETSTARHYGGTGLGLTISRQLAELMGGTLWLDSMLGKGTTFYLTVEMGVSIVSPESDLRLSVLENKRVLIVDRNLKSQQSLALQVEQWGMEVCTVGSCTEAINHLRWGDRIDLAILDWNLAEMDGFTLARQMHSLSAYRFLPLILMTTLEKDDRWATQIDFVTRLFKPIKHQALQNALIQGLQAPPSNAISAAPTESIYDRTLGQRYPLRILLAEDNPINQKVIGQMLDRLGYTPFIVSNGREVLMALEQYPYDLILMDVHMPELDGLETTRRIKQKYSNDRCPRIIAITAHVLSSAREQCELAGMDGYLSKPLRVSELTQILREAHAHSGTIGLHLIETPPVDRAVDVVGLQAFIQEVAGGDWAFFKDLVEIYIRDTNQYLQQLKAFHQGTHPNVEAMQRILHTLKSSCGSIYAQGMAEYCRCLEIDLLQYDRHQRANALQELLVEFDRVKIELEEMVDHRENMPEKYDNLDDNVDKGA